MDSRYAGSDPPEEDFEAARRFLERTIARASPAWSREDVEDMAQRAVLRLMDLRRRRPTSNCLTRAYLWRVAYTQVIDELRRRRWEVSLDSQEVDPPSRGPNPERESVSRELGGAIWRCLSRLTRNRQHAALLMLLGHKNQQVARLTGWDYKQTENYVTRGRQDLRRCLEGEGFGR